MQKVFSSRSLLVANAGPRQRAASKVIPLVICWAKADWAICCATAQPPMRSTPVAVNKVTLSEICWASWASIKARQAVSGGQPSDSPSSGGSSTGRNITDVLGDLFKQATEGTKEGAQRIDDATGTSSKIEDLSRQLAGKSPQELIDSLKDLISQNKLGTGAALGGLGALILGTQTGRSAAATAAKLGALALIGGLAYKAYKNYQDGQQADAAATGDILAPPIGSGFEPEAVSNDDAVLMVRTMIAAAAADGRIDSNEQKRILSNLQNDGELEPGAEEFLARELNAPASVEDITAAVHSKEQAAQVYAAARIAVDPDTRGEQAFLYDLARRLDIERDLAQHINAAARNA